jgi:site-specific recombinase XerD
MDGAYSANTIRSYRADLTIFEAWCERMGQSAFPASPETVASFVLAQSEIAAPATVGRRRAAIAKIHRLLKFDNPVATEEVNLATRSVFRRKSRRQHQALGLTNLLKAKVIKACSNDMTGLRDRALIALGYDTLCRRSELVQLQIEDLKASQHGAATILVRRAKSDQFGDGRVCYISPSALSHLRRWLRAANLESGLIFRSIRGKRALSIGLHPYSVSRIIKNNAAKAKLGADIVMNLSGHSMRVGAAQDMAAAGIELPAIMHAGGWKTPDIAIRYIERLDVIKSGMAQLYEKIGG